METFSALLAICAGNSPVPGEFPTQRPVTRSFDVFFDLRLKNRWLNNREVGDYRRYRAHYGVTVMTILNTDVLTVLRKIVPVFSSFGWQVRYTTHLQKICFDTLVKIAMSTVTTNAGVLRECIHSDMS